MSACYCINLFIISHETRVSWFSSSEEVYILQKLQDLFLKKPPVEEVGGFCLLSSTWKLLDSEV